MKTLLANLLGLVIGIWAGAIAICHVIANDEKFDESVKSFYKRK